MSDVLTEAQDSLGKALDQARAGEDRALAQQVREGGEQIVRLLTGLLRLTRTHLPDNHAFDQPTQDFSAVLARMIDLLGPLHMVCVEGQVYLNDVRIRMDDRVGGGSDLAEELKRHGCGGLSFGLPFDQAGVRRLIATLSAKPSSERPLGSLQAALRDADLASVTVAGLFRLRLTGETGPAQAPDKKEIRETLTRAAGQVTEAWNNLADAKVPNPLPVRRLVNELVDGSNDTEALLEAEEGMTGTGGAHAQHSLRVTTLAVLIGREIGLSSASLADLGVAAMFHDSGYAAREDGFALPFARHGTAGARMLLKQRGFHQAKIKRLLVAIEHHRPITERPTLYSRIVHVADDFDTLTRPRAHGPLMSPDQAIARMAAAGGRLYDPMILQALINRVGRYPPGTLLELTDGRWVISISGARTPETFEKPLCRIVRQADGEAATEGARVDLAVEGEVARVLEAR